MPEPIDRDQEAIAGLEEQAAEKSGRHFLLIGFSNSGFALESQLVKRIMPAGAIYPLPETADFVVGVANLGGEIVPVIDPGLLLKLDGKPKDKARLVLCQYQQTRIALLVDEVTDLVQIDEQLILPNPGPATAENYLAGEFVYQEEKVNLLDLAGIIEKNKAGQ